MPPSIALFAWFVMVVALWRFDPAKVPGTSAALWVPLIWLFIVASRLPSQWLGTGMTSSAQALEEGNPVDRTLLFFLIVLSVWILTSRSLNWSGLLASNVALTLFLGFALISFVWSDFPFIALKRWIRDLGNYLVILVVLTDPRPLEAVRALLRRLCYILIPLCVVLIKYFPEMSKAYDLWTGKAYYVGVTTSKNMLGVLCLISGIFFFWDTVTRWSNRRDRRTKRILLVNGVMIAMTLWLLQMANSATSRACLAFGCLIIALAHTKTVKRHPGFLKGLMPVGIVLYVLVTYVFGINLQAEFAGAVGRDPTLTGRTDIWTVVLSMGTNPIIGTGYESFWLGPRLLKVWELSGGINEAHNGYLETYLNLGIIGVGFLLGFLVATYRSICKGLSSRSEFSYFALALWIIVTIYNLTESAFKGQLMWVIFLLAVIEVPRRAARRSAERLNGNEDKPGRSQLQESLVM